MKNKKNNQVTLPIAAKMMYLSLAKIAWRVEQEKNGKKSNLTEDEFKEKILQELGADGFLNSFTPGGEIGSGDSDYRKNPTRDVSQDFYSYFNEFIGENGSVTKLFSEKTSNNKVVNNKLFRLKSSFVNLVDLYIEATIGKEKSSNEFNNEINQYLKMFIASAFLVNICQSFDNDIDKIADLIDSEDLANINSERNIQDKINKLKDPRNKKMFIKKVINILMK